MAASKYARSPKPAKTRALMSAAKGNYWSDIKMAQVMQLNDAIISGELGRVIVKELGEIGDTIKEGEALSGDQRWLVNRLTRLLAKHAA